MPVVPVLGRIGPRYNGGSSLIGREIYAWRTVVERCSNRLTQTVAWVGRVLRAACRHLPRAGGHRLHRAIWIWLQPCTVREPLEQRARMRDRVALQPVDHGDVHLTRKAFEDEPADLLLVNHIGAHMDALGNIGMECAGLYAKSCP
jgi:hypothetical protein